VSYISFQGRGTAFVTIGWGGNPTLRANLGTVGSNVGVLLQVEPSGRWRFDADISDFERARNPAGGPVDSNPYGVLVLAGDKYVTDAGGNDLLRVAANGEVSLVATFPPASNGAEPVPISPSDRTGRCTCSNTPLRLPALVVLAG
jgi:hypothetical protein